MKRGEGSGGVEREEGQIQNKRNYAIDKRSQRCICTVVLFVVKTIKKSGESTFLAEYSGQGMSTGHRFRGRIIKIIKRRAVYEKAYVRTGGGRDEECGAGTRKNWHFNHSSRRITIIK